MKKALFLPIQVSFCTVGYLFASTNITQAQVTTDGTVNTQVNQNGTVSEITGGETRGDNLFHSFQDFSVQTGNEAFFDNASDISNIFSRVTGASISNIDGLIRANDSASLFLINPNGIIFGENARLDIGGSFYGSSASSILFEGGEFSAADLDNPPLLTVNAPIGLGFRDNPQPISNLSVADGRGLQVDSGQNITLVGGDILFDRGATFAAGGRIEFGGIAAEGIVSFNEDLSLSFSEGVTLADISLTNGARINVRAENGGTITTNSQNFEVLSGSQVFAGITSGSGSPENQAGNININSTDTVTIAGELSLIANAVEQGTIGQAGDVNITADSLVFSNGGQANSLTQGQGNAGNVNVTATNISLENADSRGNSSGIFTTVNPSGVGDAGNISVVTNELSFNSNC